MCKSRMRQKVRPSNYVPVTGVENERLSVPKLLLLTTILLALAPPLLLVLAGNERTGVGGTNARLGLGNTVREKKGAAKL